MVKRQKNEIQGERRMRYEQGNKEGKGKGTEISRKEGKKIKDKRKEGKKQRKERLRTYCYSHTYRSRIKSSRSVISSFLSSSKSSSALSLSFGGNISLP